MATVTKRALGGLVSTVTAATIVDVVDDGVKRRVAVPLACPGVLGVSLAGAVASMVPPHAGTRITRRASMVLQERNFVFLYLGGLHPSAEMFSYRAKEGGSSPFVSFRSGSLRSPIFLRWLIEWTLSSANVRNIIGTTSDLQRIFTRDDCTHSKTAAVRRISYKCGSSKACYT